MKNSKAQIIATVGPASEQRDVLLAMLRHNVDVIRLNFSWADPKAHAAHIALIRELEKECGRHIPIIQDLPGPRIQSNEGHAYDDTSVSALTDHDKELIQFGIEQGVEYIAMSFVGAAEDIEIGREIIKKCSSAAGAAGAADISGASAAKPRIIAKIERKIALDHLDDIIAAADAVMVARGDLGNEIPIEQVPFAQARIIKKCNLARKPVITATQMMFSMVESPVPTRAEVTDVANAILLGSDAVMLSDETAKGKYPIETVTMMEKIVLEAERHMAPDARINLL